MTTLFYIVLFLFVALCVLLCFVILIQESKSMGLGASFGGDSGDSLFGTSTASVLKKFTAYLAGIFLITCLILSLWTSAMGRSKPQLGVNMEEVSGG
ncbi:MAG: preprotein translocase subunit SecG [Simkaniaceae bacterium]|nr:preprotein translocase subunit SecG [Simkaniaceae bacterium]